MRHLKRLDKLKGQLRTIAANRARAVSYRSCAALDWGDLAMAVGAAVKKEDATVFLEIMSQAADYRDRGRPNRDGTPLLHGFIVWVLCDLAHGWSSLPAKLPTDLLTAWSKGYIRDAGGDHKPISPFPSVRCEACYLVHPNRDARGGWGGPDACSACGGTRLSGRVYFRGDAFSMDGGRTLIEADAWTRR